MLAPLGLLLVRGGERGQRVVGRGVGDLGDRLAGRRVLDREGGAARSRPPTCRRSAAASAPPRRRRARAGQRLLPCPESGTQVRGAHVDPQSRGSAHAARWRGILAPIPAPRARLRGFQASYEPRPSMLKRAATLTVLIVAVACTGTAGAAERWSMRGAGWGHGIGLSQWGSYGYAKQGAGYRDIVDHYYRDTKIETRDGGDRAGAAAAEPPDRLLPATPPRPATGCSTRTPSTRPRASATRSILRSATGQKARARSTAWCAWSAASTCGCSDAPTTACATASTAARSRSAPPPARG